MTDRMEALIREAFAAEADRSPDPRPVLDALARARPTRRRTGLAVLTAGVVVAVAAVAAVVLPDLVDRAVPPVVGDAPTEDQDVLVVGLDEHDHADAVMLVHLDTDGWTIVLSLPRDSWVSVPGAGMSRLTTVYAQSGIDPLLATVDELTGVRPDHYALVDMAAFGELAAAVGGVPVCLRLPTTDELSGASFPAGPQTLSGAAALAFLRQRHGLDDGDLDRIVRQQAFLGSTLRTLRDDPDALRHVLTVAAEHVTVDPDLNVVGLAERLASTTVSFRTIPIADGSHAGPGGTGLPVDPADVTDFVSDMFGPAHTATGWVDPRGMLPGDDDQSCID